MKLPPVGLALVLTVLGASGARAQGDRWEREVRAQLGRAAESLGAATRRPPIVTLLGTLNTDESDSLTLTLRVGTSYVVVGACDEDCSKLGLVLSDLTSHELAADHASDHAPVVRLTPATTASYRVRVVMDRCQMNPCRYGVAVLTPPAP
jgi:hypothetical protein